MNDLLNLPPSELEALIRRHRKLYYEGAPEILDAEVDALIAGLNTTMRYFGDADARRS